MFEPHVKIFQKKLYFTTIQKLNQVFFTTEAAPLTRQMVEIVQAIMVWVHVQFLLFFQDLERMASLTSIITLWILWYGIDLWNITTFLKDGKLHRNLIGDQIALEIYY